MTAADTLARVVRSSALPFDASHRALSARAHLRWAKVSSTFSTSYIPTAISESNSADAAIAARKALEFAPHGSAESSIATSDSLSLTSVPSDPAGRALLIECVAIEEGDAAAEALLYRIEHQASRSQRSIAASVAGAPHSPTYNAVALSAWTSLVERACHRGDIGNATRLLGQLNARMSEWVHRMRATSVEATDIVIATVLEADEPDGASPALFTFIYFLFIRHFFHVIRNSSYALEGDLVFSDQFFGVYQSSFQSSRVPLTARRRPITCGPIGARTAPFSPHYVRIRCM
jgi:hypothetical protein